MTFQGVSAGMRYPELAVVAALPFADYFLTLWGAKLAEGRYRAHFKTESYELNPMWRADVARRRLFNPRHLALAVALVGIVALADVISRERSAWYFPVVYGLVLGAFAPVIAQHVANLLLFDFLKRHPGEVAGVVTVSLRYSIMASLAQGLTVLAPLALAAWFTGAPIVLGMFAGAVVLTLARVSWFLRAKT